MKEEEEEEEEELIKYIAEVKNRANGVPVGYVDAYYEFANRPKLTAICDVILANCYPFLEGTNIKTSGFHLLEMYRSLEQAAHEKRVIITETGWPSKGEIIDAAEPNRENAIIYYIKTQLWAKNRNVEVFYFSSFDESWKIQTEGWARTSWGLWDRNNEIKY